MKLTALAFATIVIPAFAQSSRDVDVRILESAPPVEQPAAPSTRAISERLQRFRQYRPANSSPQVEAADLPASSNTSVRMAQVQARRAGGISGTRGAAPGSHGSQASPYPCPAEAERPRQSERQESRSSGKCGDEVINET